MRKKPVISTYKGVPATRSAISRLEHEVTALKAHCDDIKVRGLPVRDGKTTDAQMIAELRTAIEDKEATVLHLKLML
jgi:hypothetical protein